MKPNIFLTGFSGTGKTTIGREAARILGWRFVDLDERIEADAGTTIDAIFAAHGEPHFRALEARALLAACQDEPAGRIHRRRHRRERGQSRRHDAERRGRMLLKRRRRPYMSACWRKAWAKMPSSRPMLAADDPLERIRSLKSQRQLNYTLAHWTVHTDAVTLERAAREVVRAFDILKD